MNTHLHLHDTAYTTAHQAFTDEVLDYLDDIPVFETDGATDYRVFTAAEDAFNTLYKLTPYTWHIPLKASLSAITSMPEGEVSRMFANDGTELTRDLLEDPTHLQHVFMRMALYSAYYAHEPAVSASTDLRDWVLQYAPSLIGHFPTKFTQSDVDKHYPGLYPVAHTIHLLYHTTDARQSALTAWLQHRNTSAAPLPPADDYQP